MRPRNGVAAPREREMYANLTNSEPHACDSLLQKPNVFFSRAQVQNDDVYRATIGVSSWHITRASPYDGGSRARRIEKCPWGGEIPHLEFLSVSIDTTQTPSPCTVHTRAHDVALGSGVGGGFGGLFEVRGRVGVDQTLDVGVVYGLFAMAPGVPKYCARSRAM